MIKFYYKMNNVKKICNKIFNFIIINKIHKQNNNYMMIVLMYYVNYNTNFKLILFIYLKIRIIVKYNIFIQLK